jgi:hypothetical protein
VSGPTYWRTKSFNAGEPLPEQVVTNKPAVAAREGQSTTVPDIKMTSGSLLEVRVLDAATQKPLSGVTVMTAEQSSRSMRPSFVSIIDTDAQGRSQFRVPPGSIQIGFSNQSAPGIRGPAVVSGGKNYSISARAKVETDGKPFPQEREAQTTLQVQSGQTHTVTFRLQEYAPPPPPPALKTYGRRMPPATAVLTGRVVYSDGRPATGIPVLALIQRQAQWEFLRAHNLALKNFRDKGADERWKAISGAMIARAVTQSNGTFRLTGLTTAPYNLNVSTRAKGGLTESASGAVAVALEGVWAKSGQVVRCARPLVLRRGALVEGRVVAKETGLPLGGVTVAYIGPQMPASSDSAVMVTTGPDGRFRARIPAGTTGFYIAGPSINEGEFVYADTQKPAHTYRIRTSRGPYAGSEQVEYVLDNQKPQYGLDIGKLLEVKAVEGQTRNLTLRLRRLIPEPR